MRWMVRRRFGLIEFRQTFADYSSWQLGYIFSEVNFCAECVYAFGNVLFLANVYIERRQALRVRAKF